MNASTAAALSAPAYSFNDLSGLQSINSLARSDQVAALEQVARQFESFFIAQMLKGMRAANEIFGQDNPVNSNEMQLRQEMLDQQLSLSLAQGRGLGLADVLLRQLRRQLDFESIPDEGTEADQNPAGMAIPGRATDRAASPPRRLPQLLSDAAQFVEPAVRKARESIEDVLEFTDKQSFVDAIAPYARRAARALGVDYRALIAQAALETGWGRSILRDRNGRSSFNLFNIKSGSFWSGPTVAVDSLEFVAGIPRQQRSLFRVYDSIAESFSDYVDVLLTRAPYRRMLEQRGDAVTFARGLQQAGYATDPQYASKIIRLLGDESIAGAP